MRLIIASNNKNKIREIKEILGDKFEEIVSMREAGIELDVKEDADSFIGNARKKAEETAKLCPQDAVLADDRVTAVTDFSFREEKGSVTAAFTVYTIFGEVTAERTVDI